jgi:hypothetical protein
VKSFLRWFAAFLLPRLVGRAFRREPDLVVGHVSDPYLWRWWLIPRNRFVNVYLHRFMRSDDDRALHDHPWWSFSLCLFGEMLEHTIARGGIHRKRLIEAGDVRFRSATFAHRLELAPGEICWTLFITGPVMRTWGFHCTDRWVHHLRFADPLVPGKPGPGCGGERA